MFVVRCKQLYFGIRSIVSSPYVCAHQRPGAFHTDSHELFDVSNTAWQDKMTFLIVMMRSTIASDFETYGKLHYAKI